MSTTVEAHRFRAVLGHFPSGVTIVTGTVESQPVGFTCQSFSALSLDPPLILVLPGNNSTSWPRIEPTGRFCVNVLAHSQQQLSTAFARSGGDKFSGIEWNRSPLGNPVLPGCCAWIDCSISEVRPGGDHLIVVGAVHELAAHGDSIPLVFHRGDYRTMRGHED